MNGKRIIVDCSTGKETLVEPDAEFLAQREIDRVTFVAEEAEQAEKDAYEKQIQDKLREMAVAELEKN